MLIKSLLQFLNMGGFAFYVWSAYGVVMVILLLNFLLPWHSKKKYLRQLANRVANKTQSDKLLGED